MCWLHTELHVSTTCAPQLDEEICWSCRHFQGPTPSTVACLFVSAWLELFFSFLQIGSHVIQAGLKLAMQQRIS